MRNGLWNRNINTHVMKATFVSLRPMVVRFTEQTQPRTTYEHSGGSSGSGSRKTATRGDGARVNSTRPTSSRVAFSAATELPGVCQQASRIRSLTRCAWATTSLAPYLRSAICVAWRRTAVRSFESKFLFSRGVSSCTGICSSFIQASYHAESGLPLKMWPAILSLNT